MLLEIERVYKDSRETYGSPRVSIALNLQGITCSENYVARLMRESGIRAKTAKAYKVTTDSNHQYQAAPNVLNRQFTQQKPNQAWAGDITYIQTKQGWLYLSVILDMYSKAVVGWSVNSRLKTELVKDSLTMALQRRKPNKGCIFHSDQGVQYSKLYHDGILKQYNLVCSMSRKGNCWDNAAVESFFKTLKSELFHDYLPESRKEAGTRLLFYIEGFYNQKRIHTSICSAPLDYERRFMS